MAIDRVQINNLRNIASADLELSSGINLVTGPNGAGKTSILEGVYLLGRGRSFRTSQAKPIIREGAECVEVVGTLSAPRTLVAGIRRCARSSEIRINGQTVDRISELACHFPVQLVTPRSHELLERGPDLRRRFLDWGLFHVEPGYAALVGNYSRVLKQRNVALKQKPVTAKSWDPQLAELGERIHRLRGDYLVMLSAKLAAIQQRLRPDTSPALVLSSSWDVDRGLRKGLEKRFSMDVSAGFTTSGPHRDDVKITVRGVPAVHRLSRGQQKLLVLGLVLAQLACVTVEEHPTPLLLLDDLAAELDDSSRERVVTYLLESGMQVLVSVLEPTVLDNVPADTRMFHVEQGCILV